MNEPIIVVEDRSLASKLGAAKPVSVRSPSELREAWLKFADAIVVGRAAPIVRWLGDLDPTEKRNHRLLVVGQAKGSERALLSAFFDRVIIPDEEVQLLKYEALLSVLRSPHRADLFIGGAVAGAAKSLVLIRGNLLPQIVPFSWFVTKSGRPRPDFRRFSIIDSGQTVRLGKYEAAADAILYDLDPEFRREAKKKQIAEDKSLGGALRRLRLQRGLSRNDFPGISAKEIARIERGEVAEPHESTLSSIASALGVKPDEIQSY